MFIKGEIKHLKPECQLSDKSKSACLKEVPENGAFMYGTEKLHDLFKIVVSWKNNTGVPTV